MSKKIVIIGAGLAGLSCAYHLKKQYRIFEKEREAGGLCRSRQVDGFTFDFTGHLLHFKSQYVFNLVKTLLDGNLKKHTRNSWVFVKDTYAPYPFQANIYSLPKGTAKDCLVGLLGKIGKSNGKSKNFFEWMMHKFGKGVVRHFMLPYNLKFWKTHPRHLTCEWVNSRIPLPSLEDSIVGAFENSTKLWGYNYHFWYPKKGGIAALPKVFEKKIKKIDYNHKVKKIDLKRRLVIFDNSFTTEFDYLVSSIPLVEMEKIIFPLPLSVKKAINKLKYLSILNLNLGISCRNFDNKHWIYFPDDKIVFYRIGFYNNFSPNLAPADKTSLYIEVSYLKDDPFEDVESLIEKINNDLAKINIVSDKNQIVSSCINDIKYGYVIYDNNYSQARKIVLEFLNKNKIFSIGRFGSWRYLSMEESIIDGKNVAERLN